MDIDRVLACTAPILADAYVPRMELLLFVRTQIGVWANLEMRFITQRIVWCFWAAKCGAQRNLSRSQPHHLDLPFTAPGMSYADSSSSHFFRSTTLRAR